jgi:hypothetical protein
LVFKITNAGSVSATLHLMGREPAADFRVTDRRGRMIWSRLRGQTMLGALRLFSLEAGKSLSFRDAWDQRTDAGRPVTPGEYLVRGVLLTDDPAGLASAAVRLRVIP